MDISRASSETRFLIGIIADEETTIGFLMAGIGEVFGVAVANKNYFIVTNDTPMIEVEKFFTSLYSRKNIGAILIGTDIYHKLSHVLHKSDKQLPILLEIPNKFSISLKAPEDEKETYRTRVSKNNR